MEELLCTPKLWVTRWVTRGQHWASSSIALHLIFLYLKKHFVIYVCLPAYIYLCIMHVLSVLRGQTKAQELDGCERWCGCCGLNLVSLLNRLSNPLYLLFLAWVSYWIWISSGLASKPQRSSCVCLSIPEATVCLHGFYMGFPAPTWQAVNLLSYSAVP